ncbi:hypothetical protein BDE02_12G099900 [Populus trichocarpa]|nr:hypothetical protein BDE02_12G099900 [Populus trichocarpa]
MSIGCELEKFPFGISQLHKHMKCYDTYVKNNMH